jgi:hypothetical protein
LTMPDAQNGTLYAGFMNTTCNCAQVNLSVVLDGSALPLVLGLTPILFYQPVTGQAGIPFATFNYSVSDGIFTSNVATVTINVKPFAVPPVVSSSNITMNENAEITVFLLGYDPNGFAISAIITQVPSQGTLKQADGVTIISNAGTIVTDASRTVIYAPASFGYSHHGEFFDTFQFILDNGVLQSTNFGSIDVWVTMVPYAPETQDFNLTILEDTQLPITIYAFDHDWEANLTVSIDTIPTQGVLYQTDGTNPLAPILTPGTFVTYTASRAPPNTGLVSNRILFIPDLYYNGIPYCSFSYTVSNGLLSASGTGVINVVAVNNAPWAFAVLITTLED